MSDTDINSRLLPLSPECSIESTPSWSPSAVIYTISPILIRAAFSKEARKCLKKSFEFIKDSRTKRNAVREKQRQLASVLNQINQRCVVENKLKPLTQSQFNSFEIKDGKRVCDPGFDYSNVDPGKVPCLFFKTEGTGGETLKSFLGNFKKWPNDSVFADGCIFGFNCSSGQRSKLWKTFAYDNFILEEGSIICDSSLGSFAEIKDTCIGLGKVKLGDHARAGRNVRFKESFDHENDLGGYRIGDHFTAAENFKMYGNKNQIGNNASLSNGFLVSNSTIGCNLNADGGLIASCLINADGDQTFSISNSKIIANERDYSILKGMGRLEACKIDANCMWDDGVAFQDCQITATGNLFKDCHFINCKINNEDNKLKQFGQENKFEQCLIDHVSIKDSVLVNCEIDNSKIVDSKIKGNDSVVLNTTLSGNVEFRGKVNFDSSCVVTGYLKIYENNLHNNLMPQFEADTKCLIGKCVLEGDINKTFVLHSYANAGKTKYSLNNCSFSNVETLQARSSHVKFNNTESIETVTWSPKKTSQSVRVSQGKNVDASTTEQIAADPVNQANQDILDGYDESIEQMEQMEAENQKAEFVPHESNIVPSITDEQPAKTERSVNMGPR